MFDRLIEILKANPRKIVFTEGPDARILEAADRLKKDGFLTPILDRQRSKRSRQQPSRAASTSSGLEIIDPATYPGMDEMVAEDGRAAQGQDDRRRSAARRCPRATISARCS